MRKQIAVAVALALALSACGGAQEPAQEPEPEAVEETTTEPEEVEEEAADQGVTIEWTQVSSADEAAAGAGFEVFGVPEKFVIGDLEFTNPTYAYAGGVAQATYETPATMVYVRKAEGYYSTPISDRALDEFAAKWIKVCSGIEVTCYGPARGAVTFATWTDGIRSYGLTFQGLGGDEMSMDSDELEVIVKGIGEANVDQKAEEAKPEEEKKEEEKKEESKSSDQSSSGTKPLISEMEADAMVTKDSGGECISVDRVTTKQYGECWYAVAIGKDGTRYEYYVTNDGVHLIDKKPAQNNSSQSKTGEHYEGEPVTIFNSIYAEWHQVDGKWYATFVTYNGTQIFAQPGTAGGGWIFNAIVNGKPIQVFYSDVESSVEGKVGPGGVSSHWVTEDGKSWY